MIAPIKTTEKPSAETLHRQFINHIIPAVQLHASVQFRHLKGQDRDDALQETQAVAWQLYVRAVELGKDPTGFSTCIADFAVRRVRCGRLFAGSTSNDVLSPAAQRSGNFEVHSLDDDSCDKDTGWKAAVAQDSRDFTPADAVAFRLDFERWMAGLGGRDREVGERLAVGDRPKQLAKRYGVTPSMISIIRRGLSKSWASFQGVQVFEVLV